MSMRLMVRAAWLLLLGGCASAPQVRPDCAASRPASQSAAEASKPANACPIVCDQPEFDFGGLWAGETIYHEFEVKNISNKTVWVKPRYIGSGSICAAIYPIAPRSSTRIPVALATPTGYSTLIKKVVVLEIVPPPVVGPRAESPPAGGREENLGMD